jgi:uncharacterized protein YybS (DUF2232 family)
MAQTLTESALMAALSFLLYIAGYTPLLSAFVLLASPLPITWVGVRYGGRQAALSALCAAVVVGLVLGPPDAYLYLVPFGLLGTLTGYLYYRDEDSVRMLWIGTSLLFVTTTPAALLLEKAMGLDDPVSELKKLFEPLLTTPIGWIPGLDPAVLKQSTAFVSAQISTMVRAPLAFFLVLSFALFYCNHLASFLLFWRFKMPVCPPPDIRRFRTPRFILAAIPAFLAAYVLSGGGNGQIANAVYLNLVLAGAFFSYLGGLACMTVSLDRSSLKPLARVGVSFLSLIVFWPLLILLGFVDGIFFLRDRSATPDAGTLADFRSR